MTQKLIHLVEEMPDPRCNLKKRSRRAQLLNAKMHRQYHAQVAEDLELSQLVYNAQGSHLNLKRKKERSLAEIIESVSEWRRLYTGVLEKDKHGRDVLIEYSLEDAASKVGISKKSLDDYLLQIRYGRKFGFDFEANKHKKVGVLRTFVRESRNRYLEDNKVVKLTSETYDKK